MARWSRRLASVFVVLVCVVCALGGPAAAADGVVGEMDALNRKALAAYRAGKATTARRHLLRALVLAEDNGVTKDRVLAQTYVTLGVVHLVALRQQKEAVNCFVHALQISPGIRPPSTPANGRVRRAMLEARRKVKRAASARKPDLVSEAAPPPPDAPSDRAVKENLELDAARPAEPAAAEDPPEGGAGRTLAAASTDSEEPPGTAPAKEESEVVSGRAEAAARPPASGYFWVALGVGSAVGATLARDLEHHAGRRVKAGPLSGGLLHVQPELGYQLSPGVAVSLQSRHQYIRPTEGSDTAVIGPPPRSAHAVLANLYFRILQGETLSLVGTAAIGGGSGFRLKIPPRPAVMLNSSDTVAGGPFVVGPGLALFVALGDSVVVTPSVRVLVGAPKLAGAAEGTLGVRYAF
jgi:hypothetical protein